MLHYHTPPTKSIQTIERLLVVPFGRFSFELSDYSPHSTALSRSLFPFCTIQDILGVSGKIEPSLTNDRVQNPEHCRVVFR